MPKVKYIPKQDPPIDWLMAAMLERKDLKNMTFSELAIRTGMSESTVKNLFAKREPLKWTYDARQKVCLALEIPMNPEIRFTTGLY